MTSQILNSNLFYSSCSPVTSGKPRATPLCQWGHSSTKGVPHGVNTSQYMRQAIQQREQHWVYFGKREGKANNSKRAILSTVGHTGQTRSRLLKKAHFRVVNWEPGDSDSRYLSSFHWFPAPFAVTHPGEGTHPHVAHYFWEVLKQSWCKTGKNKSGEIHARLDEDRNWEQGLVGLR